MLKKVKAKVTTASNILQSKQHINYKYMIGLTTL